MAPIYLKLKEANSHELTNWYGENIVREMPGRYQAPKVFLPSHATIFTLFTMMDSLWPPDPTESNVTLLRTKVQTLSQNL